MPLPSDPVPLHPYAEFLHAVEKPARYTGGEMGSRKREHTPEVAKVCLAFPDVYDIGMSHLGFKILYAILNDDPRTLAERCYAPWIDLEAELRKRGLPLVTLESKRPLSDFDVVGFSLQFELTFTNILTMLDLGGIPLRSRDRGDRDPLVIAGGPVATHPEPIAPFIDAIVIGDGEEITTEIALLEKRMKDAGAPRAERLRALAKLRGVYVPSLYETSLDADSGLYAVERPADPTLPFPIERAWVDIKKYPFPDESPTGGPEAIFDRMSIEIARGCTEGCRFCQAGMIYRPVRERDPEEIVDTVMRAVEKSGHDEVSLTALSTADVSCIAPLVKKVSEKLAEKKISLGVSSLRAYGLEPELLDELKRVRGTGLTFAPEAGTQRMRDVINKNVTEEQLLETAERVFSRGWGKMKLYFIAGLPTETEDDVRGIVDTGRRALEVGRKAAKGKPAEVTISVSVHVPKPHTPFQWCAMDEVATIDEKQRILREETRKVRNLRLKTHDPDASVLEGIFARGDRRLADVIQHAYEHGARFDSWDDRLDLGLWKRALEAAGLDKSTFLGTLPITARLPWSHIDVGLEDGFLAREYRKALASRLSPPCGKAAGAFVHPTTAEATRADTRRLVCYDCGVACDMTAMRDERIRFHERIEASTPKRSLPLVSDDSTMPTPVGLTPDDPSQASARKAAPTREGLPSARYRFWFEKVGPVALIGHLDLVRELPRVFRRAGVAMVHTKGFHPKPDMTFSPALSLGVLSLEEAFDVKLHGDFDDEALVELAAKMTECAPEGLRFLRASRLEPKAPSLGALVGGARYAVVMSRKAVTDALGGASADEAIAARIEAALAASDLRVKRTIGPLSKIVDVRSYLVALEPLVGPRLAEVRRAGLIGDLVGFVATAEIRGTGAAKATEIADAVLGEPLASVGRHLVRLSLLLRDPPPAEPRAVEAVAAPAFAAEAT